MKQFSLLLLTSLLLGCQSERTWTLESPGRKHLVRVEEKGLIFASLHSGEQTLIDTIKLGLDLVQPLLSREGWRVQDVNYSSSDSSWERIWGRSRLVRDHYHAMEIEVLHKASGIRMHIHFRAYPDGIAFHYELPEQEGLGPIRIAGEQTTFCFSGNPLTWSTIYGGSYSHQENEFLPRKLSDLGATHLPLLIERSDSAWLALSEARLVDYAGFHLEPDASLPGQLHVVLEPRRDEPGLAVKAKTRIRSPWRVIMIASAPGSFLESNLIQNLNDPCQLEETGWITPGKSAWDWWWCNSYAPAAGFELGSNQETMKYFIDFAAEMGWEYQLVDWHWYGPPFRPTEDFANAPNPDVDIRISNPDIDIAELVQYADSKKVKLLLWLEWNHADWQMEEAFPLYEEWGVAGVKVDFMAREDQEMVEFYERLVRLAARHRLVVDFHGAYKPTGLSRTWPNLMTREGVLGNEYTKWSHRVTPEHTVSLAFTRNILGEMDFTPGAFVNVSPEAFKLENEAPSPMVMASRCNQLAMMVVFESALQVLCDSPDNYRNSPAGLDFLQMVPTTWDETQVVNGEIGNYITVARRSGKDWYLGSMNDGKPRELEIGLNFLGEGLYRATLWKDATGKASEPVELIKEETEVDAGSKLHIHLAGGGGMAAHLTLLE